MDFEEVRHKQVCSATEKSQKSADSDIDMWTFWRQTDVENQKDPN